MHRLFVIQDTQYRRRPPGSPPKVGAGGTATGSRKSRQFAGSRAANASVHRWRMVCRRLPAPVRAEIALSMANCFGTENPRTIWRKPPFAGRISPGFKHTLTWSVADNSCGGISRPAARRKGRPGHWRKSPFSTPVRAAANAFRPARRGSSSSCAAIPRSISNVANAPFAAPVRQHAKMAPCCMPTARPRRGRSRRGSQTPASHNAAWSAAFAVSTAR